MFELRTFGGVALLRDGSSVDGPAIQRRRLDALVQLAVAGEPGTESKPFELRKGQLETRHTLKVVPGPLHPFEW